LALGSFGGWQAIPDKKAAQIKTNNTFFNIKLKKTS
jgi:hypothetical protein